MTLAELFFKYSPILKFKVHEESMLPSLKSGQIVFAERLSYLLSKPKVGDLVVILSANNMFLIKWLVDYYEGEAFVLGENQSKSIDSRTFGLINKNQIMGKVFYVI